MKIKIYSRHVTRMVENLHDAFCYKSAIEMVWNERVHVVLSNGISIEKELPAYRVRVHVPFVSVSEIEFEYFATFEAAMKRVEEAHDLGFNDVDMEKYRIYRNGIRRWVPVG